MKIKLFLFCAFLILNGNLAMAQNCHLEKPLIVTGFKGRLLFQFNSPIFSLKAANVKISEKRNGTYYTISEFQTSADGYFEIQSLKPGKYYLSVFSSVGSISYLEFEITAKNNQSSTDNLIEIVLNGSGNNCQIETVKSFENRETSGSTASREWESITEISIEQAGCPFGGCPEYKVTLRKDGTATYISKSFNPKSKYIYPSFTPKPKGIYQGKYQGEFQYYGFERLAELIYRQGFFNLKERYEVPITDLDTAIITVVRDGKIKQVVNYGGAAPVEFWGVETAIGYTVDNIKWKKENIPTKK